MFSCNHLKCTRTVLLVSLAVWGEAQHAAAQTCCISPPPGVVSWWQGEDEFQPQLVEETFDNIDLAIWAPFGKGTVEAQDGKLFVEHEDGVTGGTGIRGLQFFGGDFDITVDFSDHEIFSPANLGSLTLRLEEQNGGAINFERRFAFFTHQILAEGNGPTSNAFGLSALYANTSGQLRMFRIGNQVTFQFRPSRQDPFTTLGTRRWESDPVRIVLFARNDGWATGVRGNFDNLQILAPVAVAIDTVGSNHGIFFAGSFKTGKVENAFHFDGSAVIELSEQPLWSQSQAFTIDAWVKFDDVAKFDRWQEIFNNNQVFFRKDSTSEGDLLSAFVKLDDGSLGPRASSTTPVVPDMFYHVATTWDGTILTLYLNGQLEETESRLGALTTDTVQAQIGRGEQMNLLANPFYGQIDEVQIFDRALSDTEIEAIFNVGSLGQCLVPPTPVDEIESLIADVLALDPGPVKNGLVAKLNNALGALQDGNPNNDHVAANKVQDFIDQMEGLSINEISETDADQLIETAHCILVLLD